MAAKASRFRLPTPEAWLLEMVGTGGHGGAVWIARRVPDGMITAHANHSRIGIFPLHDPKNCLYSKNIISFAIEKGYYSPTSGKAFEFNNVYDPPSPAHLKYTATRVWSIFRRAAPSLHFTTDYNRGIEGVKPYPLFIKPDKKLRLQDVFSLIRDHYEGTAFDMTSIPEGGPFGNPNRPRPLSWSSDSANYSWERPISTYNTAFSFVAQLRNYLPDNIGGIMWFGEDDTYTNCYFPVYCCVTEIPKAFTIGDIRHYSRESAWWTFNFVANFANVRYRNMVIDIKKVQKELENTFISQQDSIENIALQKSGNQRIAFLTQYTRKVGEKVQHRWQALGDFLITKYNDGYVKDKSGHIKTLPFLQKWTDFVIKNNPDKHKIRKWKNK